MLYFLGIKNIEMSSAVVVFDALMVKLEVEQTHSVFEHEQSGSNMCEPSGSHDQPPYLHGHESLFRREEEWKNRMHCTTRRKPIDCRVGFLGALYNRLVSSSSILENGRNSFS